MAQARRSSPTTRADVNGGCMDRLGRGIVRAKERQHGRIVAAQYPAQVSQVTNPSGQSGGLVLSRLFGQWEYRSVKRAICLEAACPHHRPDVVTTPAVRFGHGSRCAWTRSPGGVE